MEFKKKKARVIPFGYKIYYGDTEYLEPIELELKALEKAFQYRKQNYPLRSIREWLVKTTGRNISFVGLHKIFKKHGIRPNTST